MPFATLETQVPVLRANLKVVGVGGGGCNAINSMIKQGISGVEFIAINTDAQSLDSNLATKKITVGTKITKGLGAGANPEVGKAAAEEDRARIEEALVGANMVFITAGMGGGTGTGAAPIVAQIAKQNGALVVSIVTKPFNYEGPTRKKNAESGLVELKKHVDSLIIIKNSKLHELLDKNLPAFSGYDKPNEILYEATKGIAEIITFEGKINVDFADVKTVMESSGMALMGTGTATGDNRAIEAAQKAISSPLLEGMDIRGAKAMLVNITASSNLTMHEVEEGMATILEATGEDVNVIFGLVEKEEMKDYVSFTVIATGFDSAVAKPTSNPEMIRTAVQNPVVAMPAAPVVPQVETSRAPQMPQVQINSDDINIPAILRDGRLGVTTGVPEQKTFSFSETRKENINELKFKSNPNSVPKEEEEDRSAAFLRNIMD
ncbi:MAG: cell division protein FtsZ [Bacteroidetes bacterium]|nr:cell division protein FtsZ [Bacteroidota bacterium]